MTRIESSLKNTKGRFVSVTVRNSDLNETFSAKVVGETKDYVDFFVPSSTLFSFWGNPVRFKKSSIKRIAYKNRVASAL